MRSLTPLASLHLLHLFRCPAIVLSHPACYPACCRSPSPYRSPRHGFWPWILQGTNLNLDRRRRRGADLWTLQGYLQVSLFPFHHGGGTLPSTQWAVELCLDTSE